MRKFGSLSKTLTTSRLNFVDTDLSLKTGLKRPKRVCKRATVARQLWPFHISSVALLQIWRARTRKPVGFSDSFKPVSRSVWRVLVEVFLLILLTVIRHLAGAFPSVWLVCNQYIDSFSHQITVPEISSFSLKIADMAEHAAMPMSAISSN